MPKKFSGKEREYWANVCIACSQVTFGVFWGAGFFPPLDGNKIFVIVFNLIASVIFWWIGRLFTKN
jgi:hypothetical protein